MGACSCCPDTDDETKRVWSYYWYFFKFAVISWILRDYGAPLLKHIPALQHCDDISGDKDMCYGKEGVYRISFALVLFYSILFAVTFKASPESPRDYFDKHFFGLKYLGLLALIFVCFTLPGDAIKDYAEVARVFGIFFMAFQSVQMLEIFYRWEEWWLKKVEDHDGWTSLLVGGTVSLYALSLVAIGMSYHYFSGCDFNIVVTTVTLAIGVLTAILSIAMTKHGREGSGVLSACFCFAYCVYLLWAAIGSEPETCVQGVYKRSNNDWTTVISIIIMLNVVAICCVNSARDQNAFSLSDDGAFFSPSLAHFVFVLSSAFVAMLLTGWEVSKHQGEHQGTFDMGWTSVWIKIATQWFTTALYVWSLFAPVVLPDRF